MKRTILILAGVALLVAVRSAGACGYGMPSRAARFALADCVVVGKVVGIEQTMLRLPLRKGTEPVPHRVFVLKVGEMLKGNAQVTHLRVAAGQHLVQPVGFEGCFFLNAHAEEPVHVLSARFVDYPIQKENNPGFANEVAQLRKMAGLLHNPRAGLTAQSADDRFLTAALLVSAYRSVEPGLREPTNKQEPIDPEQSRLILKVLAECDWNRDAADFRMVPWRVFNQLGMTEKDGWKPPTGDRAAEAKRWLKANQDTFRIQAFVRR